MNDKPQGSFEVVEELFKGLERELQAWRQSNRRSGKDAANAHTAERQADAEPARRSPKLKPRLEQSMR